MRVYTNRVSAAAYAMGAMTARDCWTCAYHRGRLSFDMKTISPSLSGAMVSVGLGEEEAYPYLQGSSAIVVACVNSPSNVTLSGDSSSLSKLEDQFKADGVFARRLKVENAYHSPHMETTVKQYYDSIEHIELNSVPSKSSPIFFSSVTGAKLDASQLGPSYWVRNMVSPVQFVKALDAMIPTLQSGVRRRRRDELSIDTVIEIGPHAALQGPVRQILTKNGHQNDVNYISTLFRGKNAAVSALETIGALWAKGLPLDLQRVNTVKTDSEPQQCLTDLPNYPWK